MSLVPNLPDIKGHLKKGILFDDKQIINEKIESDSGIQSFRVNNNLNLII